MAIPKMLTALREKAYDGDIVTSKMDTKVTVTQSGNTLIVSEKLLIKDGAKITFVAPCDSNSIEKLTVNNVSYDLCLYEGCDFSVYIQGPVYFTANTYVTVILNTSELKAYIVNGHPKTTIVDVNLSAGSWTGLSPYTCQIILDGVTATSIQEILPGLNITASQLEALQLANIVDGGQSKGSITLKAFGDKPTISIPLRILLRGER